MIPPVLHRIWTESSMPVEFKDWQNTWNNCHPNFALCLWDRERIYAFMAKQPPNIQFFFENLKFDIQRWDFFRLLLLDEYGGIYADWDVELLRPIAPFLDRPLLLSYCKTDCSRVSNAIMGASPHQPFWEEAVDMLMREYNARLGLQQEYAQQIILTTGPIFLTAAVNRFLSPDVPAASRHFFPFDHHEKEARRHENFPNAYAKHHWFGSWSFEPVAPRTV